MCLMVTNSFGDARGAILTLVIATSMYCWLDLFARPFSRHLMSSIGRWALFRLPHAVTTIAVVCRDCSVFSLSGVLQRPFDFIRGDWAGEGEGSGVLVVSAS